METAPNPKLNQKFAYTVGGVLLLIAACRFIFKHSLNMPLIGIAVALLLLAFVKPAWLTPLRLVWDKFGHLLGIMNGYILLTLFYFLILTPLSLLMRLTGKDILKLKRSARTSTYWEEAVIKPGAGMKNQF